MNRRRFILSTGSIVSASIAGCLTSDSNGSGSSNSSDESGNSEESGEPNDSDLDLEEPGEPTYIVDSDGGEDYEDLSEAYRVSEDEDVISIRSGEYELELDREINVHFVGTGIDETTVSLLGGEHSFSGIDISFSNLTFLSEEESYLYINADLEFNSVSSEVPVAGWSGGDSGTITAKDSEFSPSNYNIGGGGGPYIRDDPINVGRIDAYNCEFDCSVNLSRSFSINNSVHEQEFVLEGNASGKIDGSVLNGLIFNRVRANSEFTNCEMNPITNTDIAIEYDHGGLSGGTDFGRSDFLNNKISGKIECDGMIPNDVIGNIFEAEDVEWYIDQQGPKTLYRNAFVGGDIRYNHDAEVYNEDQEIGNFYSDHDNKDESGDGITDLPRPIPGDAELTDRYPLASQNLEGYR